MGMKEIDRTLPLDLALSIADLYEGHRKHKLRFGINHGSLRWINMTDNTRQLIGYAVNWAVRIMKKSEGNQILLDQDYYERMIKQIPEAKYGAYHFPSAGTLTTKHGETIVAYKVEKK